MLEHGINTVKNGTNFAATTVAEYGIPCFIGAWPCHTAGGYTGKPQIAHTYAEAVAAGGYSEEWRNTDGSPKWSLCQAMYAHLKLAGISPVIFINVYDPSTHKTAVPAVDMPVEEHCVILSDAIKDNGLSVAFGDVTLEEGKDFDAFYEEGCLVIELLEDSTNYAATSLKIGYHKADLSGITAETIETAIESVERCKTLLGVVPDLLCAPGWSQTPSVAAVLAVKAANINGLYKAKAVVDLNTASDAADTYDDVAKYKAHNGYTDENQIVCWPLVKLNGYIFDMSVLLCGAIASIDAANGNCPYESPSNKLITISGACNAAGEDISLTVQEADAVSGSGVITVLNFDGWRTWGNYTACWPGESDVAKNFICTSRMQDWICNKFIDHYWSYIDRPMTRVFMDAVVDRFNLWLAGLKSEGKLCDGKVLYVPDNNTTQLIGGRFRIDARSASPVPAQRIDMHAEFDVDMLLNAFNDIVA